MTSISSISSTPYSVTSSGATSQVNRPVDSDGDNDGGSRTAGTGGKDKFVNAIMQAFSQLGVSGTTASTSATTDATADTAATTQNPAMSDFMHKLFAALQSESSQSGTATTDSTQDASTAASSVQGHHHAHGGGGGKMQADLQSLIQQVSDTSSSSKAETDLNDSFKALTASLGGTSSQATLGSFLQALSQNMQGAGPSGNAVNTQV